MAAPYQFTLTFSHTWKGHVEEWSNSFHYDVAPLNQNTAGYTAILDAIAAALKPLHSNTVTLVRGRVNGPTDQGKVANVMEVVKDYNQVCTAPAGEYMAPELSIIGWVYLGRGPKGGKQILRKYLHTCSIIGSSVGNAYARSEAALTSALKDPYRNALDGLKNIIVNGAVNSICNDQGKHLPDNSAWAINDFVATRQFKRGRKEYP